MLEIADHEGVPRRAVAIVGLRLGIALGVHQPELARALARASDLRIARRKEVPAEVVERETDELLARLVADIAGPAA